MPFKAHHIDKDTKGIQKGQIEAILKGVWKGP